MAAAEPGLTQRIYLLVRRFRGFVIVLQKGDAIQERLRAGVGYLSYSREETFLLVSGMLWGGFAEILEACLESSSLVFAERSASPLRCKSL